MTEGYPKVVPGEYFGETFDEEIKVADKYVYEALSLIFKEITRLFWKLARNDAVIIAKRDYIKSNQVCSQRFQVSWS